MRTRRPFSVSRVLVYTSVSEISVPAATHDVGGGDQLLRGAVGEAGAEIGRMTLGKDALAQPWS